MVLGIEPKIKFTNQIELSLQKIDVLLFTMHETMRRVSLFIPCYMDAFEPEVGVATLELLERLGCTVDYPFDQTCCGQPMVNTGCHKEAAATEALFVKNFADYDYIVVPSASSSRLSRRKWATTKSPTMRARVRNTLSPLTLRVFFTRRGVPTGSVFRSSSSTSPAFLTEPRRDR
jgi:hypothetical protein